MDIAGKVVVGTGAARGIGAARMITRTVAENVPDNVTVATEPEFSAADLLCSNAGIATGMGGRAAAAISERAWSVNVLGPVHVTRSGLRKGLR